MSDLTQPPHVPSYVSTGEGVTVPNATPRTDDAALSWERDCTYIGTTVNIDFARTLERELSSAQAALAEAKAEVARLKGKRAPVQGYSAGIPWEMHLRAYDAYRKQFGEQAALIDLEGKNCRGGFYSSELDRFIPGWRDELSELTALRARVAELEADNTYFRLSCALSSAGMKGYYDDGEMQDNTAQPWIDWKRDSVDTIKASLLKRNYAAIDAAKGQP